MLVLTIVGILSSVMLPRLSFFFEPKSAVLQRGLEAAMDKALSGIPIRLKIKQDGIEKRGAIIAQALQKKEVPADSLSAFLGTASRQPIVLEWQSVKLKNIPEDKGWKFEPEIIYFYTDGSCSPARISWKDGNTYDSKTEEYVLTVTGYCAQLTK